LETVVSCLVATASAASRLSDGVVPRVPIGLVIATELKTVWPALLVTRNEVAADHVQAGVRALVRDVLLAGGGDDLALDK
jgi:hypothetical protein